MNCDILLQERGVIICSVCTPAPRGDRGGVCGVPGNEAGSALVPRSGGVGGRCRSSADSRRLGPCFPLRVGVIARGVADDPSPSGVVGRRGPSAAARAERGVGVDPTFGGTGGSSTQAAAALADRGVSADAVSGGAAAALAERGGVDPTSGGTGGGWMRAAAAMVGRGVSAGGTTSSPSFSTSLGVLGVLFVLGDTDGVRWMTSC